MSRSSGWESRLVEWAERRHGDPFEWGDTDCAMVCLEAADIISGGHLAAKVRGQYRTRGQALRFQEKAGTNLALMLQSGGVFKWPGNPLPGDIIIHPHPEIRQFMIGYVCLGEVCMSTDLKLGVAVGKTVDAMAMPGAGVWRVA